MPSSKYPQKLDTSTEIPPVRDNITEIGSDVINSLRSAIFNIEKTLGINPQGATGNTLSNRLATSLDSNGNLLKEALDRANVLAGPIIDSDVSKVAAIRESKLRLDFPTQLLQSEISILDSEIDSIKQAIEDLSVRLAIHLEPNALNSHKANSIKVDAADSIPSDIATLDLESNTLQNTLQEIYNSHINYSGANISSINNSHVASQIFFDNANTPPLSTVNDLQSAVEVLANLEDFSFKDTLTNLASNGRVRNGKVNSAFESNTFSKLLLDITSVTYLYSSGSSTTTFILSTPKEPIAEINQYDLLTLSGSSNEEDNITYQIKSVKLSGLLLQEVEVYGGPKYISTSGLTIKVNKNGYTSYNPAGFATVTRPRANKTNTPDVQILNPDCATIISKNIKPSNITATNHNFIIEIDEVPFTLETYNSTIAEQSLDSIVQKINDQSVDQHLNITAFPVKISNCQELAISHNIPNISSDVKLRTIKISAAPSNDGTSDLGFTDILDVTYEGTSGASLFLNGSILKNFGVVKTLTGADVKLTVGGLSAQLFSGKFVELGARVGDLVAIAGSSEISDDGTYRIKSISNDIVYFDLAGSQFLGELDDASVFHILRVTAPIDEFTFEEIGTADGTILFDVFMDENKNIFQSKRLEIEGSIISGSFYAVISDVSKGFILSDETATLNIDTAGYATLTDLSLQPGQPVFVGTSGIYNILANDGFSFITLSVSASTLPTTSISTTIYGFGEVSSNNYMLCRGAFSTGLGRILGTSNDPGIPSLVDKKVTGTVDHKVIGTTFIERYIEGPRNELRASGIIRGCKVVNEAYINDGHQIFSVTSGVVVVNGIRYEFPGIEDVRVNSSYTYIVAINKQGCVVVGSYINDPANPGNAISPFFQEDVAYLAEISNDTINTTNIDLRLFIDNLDLKVLGDIKVSNNIAHSHFTDLYSAVQYSKRFSRMFPNISPPTILIENGTYVIDETIVIDFDVSIKGSGPGTILKKGSTLGVGESLVDRAVDMSTALFLIGSSSSTESDFIEHGVSFSDFTYKTSDFLVAVGCVFALTQPLFKDGLGVSPNAMYKFSNINFDGPTSIDGSIPDPNKVGEFVIFCGQQDSATLNTISNLIMGNILFTNCLVNRMGVEKGAIMFTESAASETRNVIISNNIVINSAPNTNYSNVVLLSYSPTLTTNNIVEASNTYRTGFITP
jgi:hypothetical protein